MAAKAHRTEILIGVLAVLSIFIVVMGNIMLAEGRFPVGVYAVDMLICGVFAWDYIGRLMRSPSRKGFVKVTWYEPLAMVPAIVMDMLFGLPVLSVGLRALRLVRFVRVVPVIARLKRSASSAEQFAERSQLLYLFVIVASIVLAAAFSVLAIELGAPRGQIQNASDALWWALSTVTTVGYGDIVPSTALGRVIGMMLMVVGIGVMATLISQVSATIVESRMARARRRRRAVPAAVVARLQTTLGRVGDLSDVELATLLREIVQLHCQMPRTEAGEGTSQTGKVTTAAE